MHNTFSYLNAKRGPTVLLHPGLELSDSSVPPPQTLPPTEL